MVLEARRRCPAPPPARSSFPMGRGKSGSVWHRSGRLLVLAATVAVALVVMAAAAIRLPAQAPLPSPRPQNSAKPPAEVPVPRQRPGDAPPRDDTAVTPPPPVEGSGQAVMPPDEVACRRHLAELGVQFEDRERLEETARGCLVAWPVAITSLGDGIGLAPEAVLNCHMAEAAAVFAQDVVSPQATKVFGSPLAAVAQASAYVCRTRHGQSKISEHALGNALDISTFRLKDGTSIEVKAYGASDTDRQDFIRELRGRACGPFKTVLGPGSDADHALHIHLDLEKRRHGGTFCQ